jgi:calcineurin-like phosphoesterase family protein
MRLNIDLTQGKKPINVFFTSDFHLFHNNVLKYDNRPFNDVYEMHAVIEERWNETVGVDDVVIYLGDLTFARREDVSLVNEILERLNGTIHFVMGNHDKYEDIKKIPRFASVQDYLEVRIRHNVDSDIHIGAKVRVETLFCVMHYPIYSWNKKHHGSYHLHGHCHGNLYQGAESDFYTNRRVMDVGCMLHNYKPISYSEVIQKLSHVELEKPTRE